MRIGVRHPAPLLKDLYSTWLRGVAGRLLRSLRREPRHVAATPAAPTCAGAPLSLPHANSTAINKEASV